VTVGIAGGMAALWISGLDNNLYAQIGIVVLIALAGLSPALVVCGVAYLITTTLPGLQKEWSEMDQERGLARQRETVTEH
jgi:hypothetical protein